MRLVNKEGSTVGEGGEGEIKEEEGKREGLNSTWVLNIFRTKTELEKNFELHS